jgi:hypothetical protein
LRIIIVVVGALFVVFGISIISYSVAANLPEYPCSDPCNLSVSGNVTFTSCTAHCPYIGVAGSTITGGGIVLVATGLIFLGIGFVTKAAAKPVEA